jgi:hypothetical protein
MTTKWQVRASFILFGAAFFVAVSGLQGRPKMPGAVIWGAMGIAWAAFIYAMFLFYFVITKGDQHLQKSGIKGTAVVLSAKETNTLAQTGQFAFDAPFIWDYRLRVTLPGKAPYETTCSIARDGITEGSTVTVVASRVNRKNVMIQFEQRPISPRSPGSSRSAGTRANGARTDGGGAAVHVAQLVPHASAQPDMADELSKLADLRDRGVLSEAEFEAQKAKLLAEG